VNSSRSEIIRYLKLNKSKFSKELGITRIAIFGSVARGESTDGSDVDILVEFKPRTADIAKKKHQLKRSLSRQFGKQVDVCRLRYIKPYYRKNILADALFA
jgi:predicted nucleotidyltransferase